MSDKQIGAVILIVVAYYWLHSKGWTAYSQQPMNPKAGSRPNTISSMASTQPLNNRAIPGYASAVAGTGKGIVIPPVRSIGQANNPIARGPGAVIQRRRGSSPATGFGSMGISPSWPTSQVTATKSIRTGSGRIQVPSYATIPTTVRGPGGQGSLLNFGGGQ